MSVRSASGGERTRERESSSASSHISHARIWTITWPSSSWSTAAAINAKHSAMANNKNVIINCYPIPITLAWLGLACIVCMSIFSSLHIDSISHPATAQFLVSIFVVWFWFGQARRSITTLKQNPSCIYTYIQCIGCGAVKVLTGRSPTHINY